MEKFEKQTTFEGDRVRLRPIDMDDVDDLFEFTSDEEATRYLYNPHRDKEQTSRLVSTYYLKEPVGKYAIEHKASGKMIGTIEFRVDDYTMNGELGYTMLRTYWGQGYMSEAIKLVFDFAFFTLGVARVFAEYDYRNDNSRRLLDRLGMKREGHLRQNHIVRGALTDSIHCSILKEEYMSRAAEK